MSEDQRPPDDSTETDGKLAPGAAPKGSPKQADGVPGKRLGDFELLRELGRGGMGIVYEARQVSLNRRIALKVLPPGLGLTDTAVQRFGREARAAAGLHHTNIVPVYAIGEEEGSHFYVMELIEGEPLSRVLNDLRGQQSNPLLEAAVTQTAAASRDKNEEKPSSTTSGTTSLSDTSSSSREWFDTVARLLADVADALHYAHDRGVIHRDVKPANLMLSQKGRLCLTDFGLARVAQEPGMTVSGSFLGTPAYMSPEQIAAGRVQVDHRSDIYSLGAVLYEMLSLRRPFTGESRDEILNGIMTKDPRPPRRFNPRIPIDLETICQKAMEKDRDRRYQTAGELASDLRQYLQRGLITARRASLPRRIGKSLRRHPVVVTVAVAVLALVVLGGATWRVAAQKHEQEIQRHLADARLAQNQGEHAEALRQAEFVLEENPELAEARMIRFKALFYLGRQSEVVEEGRALVAENPDDWFGHLVLAVLGKSWGLFGEDIEPHVEAVERLAPDTPDAHVLRSMATDSPREALEHLERALEIDPGYAEAYLESVWRYTELKDFKAALAAADRFITAQPRSPMGHSLKAQCYSSLHDTRQAFAELDRAIEIDPDHPGAHAMRAEFLSSQGDPERALEEISRAIELAPEQAGSYFQRGWTYYALGDNKDAWNDARRARELQPENPWLLSLQIQLAFREGHNDEVQTLLEELLEMSRGWSDPWMRSRVHLIRAQFFVLSTGDLEAALRETEAVVELQPDDPLGYLGRARLRVLLGDPEGAEADCDFAAGMELDEPDKLLSRAQLLGTLCDRKQRAIDDLTRAIELAPRWADPYLQRGVQYAYLGSFDNALEDWNRCAELADQWTDCYRNRAIAHTRLGQYEEALRDCDKRAELTPEEAETYSIRGGILLDLGRVEEALASHDEAIERAPSTALYHVGRAWPLARMGQCDRVEEELEKAVELAPTLSGIEGNVALLHASMLFHDCPRLCDLETATELARKSLQLSPDSEVAHRALGVALYRSGRFEEAIPHQLRASAANADGAYDQFYLAMEHWQSGRRREARQYCDRAVSWMERHNPQNPQLIRLRAEASALLGL